MNRPNRSAGPQRVAAMQHFTAHKPTHNYNGLHHCNESRGNGEIKLACGCMMPVVAGALSPDRQTTPSMSMHNSNDPVICSGLTKDDLTTQVVDPVSLNTIVSVLLTLPVVQSRKESHKNSIGQVYTSA